MNFCWLLLPLIGVSLMSCHPAFDHTTYRVVLQSLPEKIDPRHNATNIYNYINSQLFYPLFERDSEGRISSHFFALDTTKALSSEFTRFQFCLNPSQVFSDGTQINTAQVRRALEGVHKTKSDLVPIKTILEKDGCIQVTLKASDPYYFDKLSGVQSTVLKDEDSKDGIAIGFGPYKLTSKTSDRIVLEEVPRQVVGTFKRVEFIRFTDMNQFDSSSEISDWNHIYHVPIPERLQSGFQEIQRSIYKTYYLLVRLPSETDRFAFQSVLTDLNLLRIWEWI